MKKKGFTLAEVLITLGIIGVVAAITLPTLMQDAARQQLGSKLAKFYTNLEKITRAAAIDEDIASSTELKDILASELLFNSDATFDTGKYYELRDGTKIQLYTIGKKEKSKLPDGVETKKYGNLIEGNPVIIFDPDIPGLDSNLVQTFKFVVTAKGYVFPEGNLDDTSFNNNCLMTIFEHHFHATKYYNTTYCESPKKIIEAD